MATTAKKTSKPVAPFYAVAAIWLGYSFLMGLHRFWDYLIVILLSVVVFRWLNTASSADEVEAEKPEEKKEPETTGNAELDKMIKDGELAISEMRRLNDSIEDEKISADIERLEKSSKAIFEQVKASPEKLPQIRKFMDYYLPTTLKLLNAYDRMSATGISGENIDTTKTKVETMMTTIVSAFEKQYDALFGADALDISTDITVLETMMAREGFAGERMEAESTKNADGTDIKLEM
ncbi:MAG: 5-bromo-4-chloroindolyl phosphate hydrolysis family protein [Oscillospiraceae bacterium]|nr:5-bromo-4-chloroindolyl phosphate hydrolysis family protein [Oscillospiraceae bacterium]